MKIFEQLLNQPIMVTYIAGKNSIEIDGVLLGFNDDFIKLDRETEDAYISIKSIIKISNLYKGP